MSGYAIHFCNEWVSTNVSPVTWAANHRAWRTDNTWFIQKQTHMNRPVAWEWAATLQILKNSAGHSLPWLSSLLLIKFKDCSLQSTGWMRPAYCMGTQYCGYLARRCLMGSHTKRKWLSWPAWPAWADLKLPALWLCGNASKSQNKSWSRVPKGSALCPSALPALLSHVWIIAITPTFTLPAKMFDIEISG